MPHTEDKLHAFGLLTCSFIHFPVGHCLFWETSKVQRRGGMARCCFLDLPGSERPLVLSKEQTLHQLVFPFPFDRDSHYVAQDNYEFPIRLPQLLE